MKGMTNRRGRRRNAELKNYWPKLCATLRPLRLKSACPTENRCGFLLFLLPFSLSPCLLVPLSPCLPLPIPPELFLSRRRSPQCQNADNLNRNDGRSLPC